MSLKLFDCNENLTRVLQVFDKTEEEANKDVEILQEWMKSQPHLPEIMEKVKIRKFLILNKFSIEKTKQKIDLYYTIRSQIPDFYRDANPKSKIMRNVMETGCLSVHPKLLDGLHRVYFYQNKVANQCEPCHALIQAFNIAEISLYEDCDVNEVIIIDMGSISINDLKKISPTCIVDAFRAYGVFSIRMRALHFINSPAYVSIVVSILKAVLKPKLFQRIHVHQDAEILKEIFTKDQLPSNYGGHGPSLDELNDAMKKKLAEYGDRFDKLDTLRVDEGLRPEKLNNDEDLGFHGNFKQLRID